MKDSELTFWCLTKDLNFVKVTWNGKVIWDDTTEVEPISLKELYDEYGNRFIYSMKTKVVFGHHCELDIKGEEESTPRQLVFCLFFKPNVFTHDYLDPSEFEILDEVKQKSTIEYLTKELSYFEGLCARKIKFYRVKIKNPKGYLKVGAKFYTYVQVFE